MRTTIWQKQSRLAPDLQKAGHKMKKLILILTAMGFMALGNVNTVSAQQGDTLEMDKDTLSIDEMDPVFYENVKEKGSNTTTTIIVIVAVVVIGGGIYYYTKSKKK